MQTATGYDLDQRDDLALVTDADELELLRERLYPEDDAPSVALIGTADGDYTEAWFGWTRRPYDLSTVYTKVL